MKILVLNRGSSSFKCALFDDEKLLWEKKDATFKDLENQQVDVIGHRIVHGGAIYRQSTLITPQVKEQIQKLLKLAPLHNQADLEGINVCEKLFKDTPQIAVFDTAFHQTLPDFAKIYPGPYSWYEEGIQRFGFHGISFQYCSRRASEMLKKNAKMVICHLGSGASLCAIKEGKSIDTTMGYTPLEGLMMDTRCGSIDPGILLLKQDKDLTKQLYEESGLLGISGISSDMRDIIASKDPRAKLAFDIYIHRLNSCIGSMIASLQGLDALVFTGGIGENTPLLRKKVCETFSFLNLHLDPAKNEAGKESNLAQTNSLPILLIHTREELEIARECLKVYNS